jgi:hypothetical protein
MPPIAEVLDALRTVIAPAALTAGTLFALVVTLGRWLAPRPSVEFGFSPAPVRPAWSPEPLAAALALTAGMAVANHFRGSFPMPPDGKWWHWAWPALGVVGLVEVIAGLPGARVAAANLLRGAAAGMLATQVLPASALAETRWLLPAAGFGLAIQWGIVDAVARTRAGASVGIAMLAVTGGTALVLLHDRSLGRADAAVMAGAALLAIVVVGAALRARASSAAALAAVIMPALLLLARSMAYQPEVPLSAYVAVGLAPLALLPALLRSWFTRPTADSDHGRSGTLWGAAINIALVAIPVGIGAQLAMRAVPNPFPGGDEW